MTDAANLSADGRARRCGGEEEELGEAYG